MSDRPGGIAELCKVMANIGVSIKDIMQERAWMHGDIFSVRVSVLHNNLHNDITNNHFNFIYLFVYLIPIQFF